MRRLDEYKHFIEEGFPHLCGNLGLLNYALIREIRGIKVGIAGFNSAWSCGRDGEQGKLWMGGEFQLESLYRSIKEARLKFALMHHPPHWLVPAESNQLEVGLERDFNFFLHGHEHSTFVRETVDHHCRFSVGAIHGATPQESGYQFGVYQVDKQGGSLWVRHFENDGKSWVPWVSRGKTDVLGQYKMGRPNTVQSELAQPKQSPPVGRKLSGATRRGIFGRDDIIAKCAKKLKKTPLLTVYGMAGVGKSTLIHELHLSKHHQDRTLYQVNVFPDTSFKDLYQQMAPGLGCRDQDPKLPLQTMGRFDWSVLEKFAQLAKPSLIHVKLADCLFQQQHGFKDTRVGELLRAIAKRVPQVRVILESRLEPPSQMFEPGLHHCQRLYGLGQASMSDCFQLHNVPLDIELARLIYKRLSGKKGKCSALPMAIVLYIQVAKHEDASTVLDRHLPKFDENIEEALFNDLYDKVLSATERHLLNLVARYRREIPHEHVDRLDKHVGEPGSFQMLHRCSLLTSDKDERLYALHRLIADLTIKRLNADACDGTADHVWLAENWLADVRPSVGRTLPNVLASSEAAQHLIEGGCYQQLQQLTDSFLDEASLARLEKLSLSLNEEEHYAECRMVLELLVRIDPKDHKSFWCLGRTIEQLKDEGNANALEHYLRAHKLKPESPIYLANIGRSYLSRKEPALFLERVGGLDEQVRLQAMDDTVTSIFADALSANGHAERASATRQERIQARSKHPKFYHDEAKCLHARGEHKQALDLLDMAKHNGASNDQTQAIRDKILAEMTVLRQHQAQDLFDQPEHNTAPDDNARVFREKARPEPKKPQAEPEKKMPTSMETEFVDMPLEPYNGRAFPSPPSTRGLLENVRKNQLLVFGGSQSMGKQRMLRHLAYRLSRPVGADPLPVKEWIRGSNLQRLENCLDNNSQPTVFILPQIQPEDINYNLLAIQSLAVSSRHYLLISTDTDLVQWSLEGKQCSFWREWKPSEHFDKVTLSRHLVRYLLNSKSSLPGWVFKPDPKPGGSFAGLMPLPELAERLKTPDQILIFAGLLRVEQKAADKNRLWQLIDLALAEERMFAQWYDCMSPEQQMFGLALGLFDGFYDDQFFAALEELIKRVWRPRNPNQPFYDYVDFEMFTGYLKLMDVGCRGQKIEAISPEQHFLLLNHAYKKNRRIIQVSLPFLVHLVHLSVEQGSSLSSHMSSDEVIREQNSDLKNKSEGESNEPERFTWQGDQLTDLFGTPEKCRQVQRSLGMVLSYLGRISIPMIGTALLQLASSPSLEVQTVVAKAVAHWRKYEVDDELFALLQAWQSESRYIDIMKKLLLDRGEVGSVHTIIRKTIILTVSFAVRHDPPNKIHCELKRLLEGLAQKRDVWDVFASQALPLALTYHLDAMSELLDSWMMNAPFIAYIGKGVAGHLMINSSAAMAQLEAWQSKASDPDCKATDPQKPFRRHEALIACVAWAYGFMEFKSGGLVPLSKAFDVWQKFIHTEEHSFVRLAVLGALGLQARSHFESVSEKFEDLAASFPESDYKEVVAIILSIYLAQRVELEGGEAVFKFKGSDYPVWLEKERPSTQVEKMLERWMREPKIGTQRIAAQCIDAFYSEFEKREQDYIKAKKERKGKKR